MKWRVFRTVTGGWIAFSPRHELGECDCRVYPSWSDAFAHAFELAAPPEATA